MKFWITHSSDQAVSEEPREFPDLESLIAFMREQVAANPNVRGIIIYDGFDTDLELLRREGIIEQHRRGLTVEVYDDYRE